MTDKPEVHQVYVEVKPVSRALPTGQVAYGFYTVVDALLTMTNQKGVAVQDDNGKTYTAKLAPNDDPQIIAGRLTKQLRDALRGKGAPPSGFSRPLDYPKSGIY